MARLEQEVEAQLGQAEGEGQGREMVALTEYKISRFLGIPYAAPPRGELRWAPPTKPSAFAYVKQSVGFSAEVQLNQRQGNTRLHPVPCRMHAESALAV